MLKNGLDPVKLNLAHSLGHCNDGKSLHYQQTDGDLYLPSMSEIQDR
jgi:hypothetical protein